MSAESTSRRGGGVRAGALQRAHEQVHRRAVRRRHRWISDGEHLVVGGLSHDSHVAEHEVLDVARGAQLDDPESDQMAAMIASPTARTIAGRLTARSGKNSVQTVRYACPFEPTLTRRCASLVAVTRTDSR
jgi:hypothetical protein